MIYELVICAGLFLGLCGHVRYVDFPNKKDCLEAQQSMKGQLGDGYSFCRPKENGAAK